MSKNIAFEYNKATDFFSKDELKAIAPQVSAAHKTICDKSGAGSDFLGWVDLPVDYDKEEFARIKAAAEKIRSNSLLIMILKEIKH